jgi:hypothetical protein
MFARKPETRKPPGNFKKERITMLRINLTLYSLLAT